MNISPISLDIADGIATVRLDDPDRRNALTASMASGLLEALDEIESDVSVAATVVTASGDFFCAGGDRDAIGRAVRDPVSPAALDGRSVVYEACRRLRTLATPTIVSVRGGAVGAGLNLVLCADVLITEPDARFIPGFQAVGLHPGGGLFLLLKDRIGTSGAAAVGLFGEEVSGSRALELGLAWALVDGPGVEAHALELASRLQGRAELSRAATASFRRQTSDQQALSSAVAGDEWPQFRSIVELGR